MDVCEYSMLRYNKVVERMYEFLKKTGGYKPENVPFIPVSALNGDNLVVKSGRTPWYNGPTLIDAMESLREPAFY